MNRGQRRSKWRLNLSATGENVRFSVQGHLGRRARWTLIAAIVLGVCALLAPEVLSEIARVLKSIAP